MCTFLLLVMCKLLMQVMECDNHSFITAVVVQAGEIALKFEPDRAQSVVQHVGPRLVEIGRYNAVSRRLTLLLQ